MDELISKIQEWLDEDRYNRSASVPMEYLVRVPEVLKIHIFDMKTVEGKNISCLTDMDNVDFVANKREKLLKELAALEPKAEVSNG